MICKNVKNAVKFAEHSEFSSCLSESDCDCARREATPCGGGWHPWNQSGQVCWSPKSDDCVMAQVFWSGEVCRSERQNTIQKKIIKHWNWKQKQTTTKIPWLRFSEVEKFGALHKREEVPPLPDTTATICFSRSVVNLNLDMFYQSDDQHKDFNNEK